MTKLIRERERGRERERERGGREGGRSRGRERGREGERRRERGGAGETGTGLQKETERAEPEIERYIESLFYVFSCLMSNQNQKTENAQRTWILKCCPSRKSNHLVTRILHWTKIQISYFWTALENNRRKNITNYWIGFQKKTTNLSIWRRFLLFKMSWVC